MSKSMADRRSPLGLFPGQPMPRLYDRAVEVLRTRHYSRRTEDAYLHWIRRFFFLMIGRQPRELAETGVNRFLTHLAVGENAVASTQNQALAAVLFLYEHVLEHPLDRIEGVVRARKPERLPVVLTRDEVHANVQTTMVYTHVLNRGGRGVHSPLDRLRKAPSAEAGGIVRTYRSA